VSTKKIWTKINK